MRPREDSGRPIRCALWAVSRAASMLAGLEHLGVAGKVMDEGALSAAFERAERALGRIERSLAALRQENGRDEQLREKVRAAVAELDQLIREAADA